MSRTYLVFGDIEGKLDVLRVECTKCDRQGRYHVHYGRERNDDLLAAAKKKSPEAGGHPPRSPGFNKGSTSMQLSHSKARRFGGGAP